MQLRSTVLAHILRDSFVQARVARPIIDHLWPRRRSGVGPSATPDSRRSRCRRCAASPYPRPSRRRAPDVLAVHVVQQTVDGLRAGGVTEARHEVVLERGVV